MDGLISKKQGLDLLREPFPPELISKLPKGTKAQNECSAQEKINCKICGGWHHKNVVHLDYVGHAALTARLLDCDPHWNWEPLAWGDDGSPKIDKDGGMWIKLTVCGVTRYGYGDAQGKSGNNAWKERIGDALRNAAMRFGAALDLWSKADLHLEKDDLLPTTGKKHTVSFTDVKSAKESAIKAVGNSKVETEIVVLLGKPIKSMNDFESLEDSDRIRLRDGLLALSESVPADENKS